MTNNLTVDELIAFAEFLRAECDAHLDKFGLDIRSEKVPLTSSDSLAAKIRIMDRFNGRGG